METIKDPLISETLSIENQVDKNAGDIPIHSLIGNLCQGLNLKQIRYCHWKSNTFIEKTLAGKTDLDLLVHRQDVQRFQEILLQLGFKEAVNPPSRQRPGIRDFYGYDPAQEEFIHVHAHYQLIIGHDAVKNIHLPLENEYLKSAQLHGPIYIAETEFEYVLLVIRMILKHCTWDSFFLLETSLSQNELAEMTDLRSKAVGQRVDEILKIYLPMLNINEFNRCADKLIVKNAGLSRVIAGQKLANQLSVFSRSRAGSGLAKKFTYRVSNAFQRRIIGKQGSKKFASGGSIVAIVGGDGSGKSTLVEEVSQWLGRDFDTLIVHMGKPHWSALTILVRSIIKLVRTLSLQPFIKAPVKYTFDHKAIKFPGTSWAIRELCTARDRYLTYKKIRKFSTNGGLCICDRYPIPGIYFMESPQIKWMYNNGPSNKLIQWLAAAEEKYYRFILPPELMIVLRVDPEISVARKLEEPEEEVRNRTKEIWEHDWSATSAAVVDANQTKEDVFNQVKAILWSIL